MPSEEELAAVSDPLCRMMLLRSRMTRSICTTDGVFMELSSEMWTLTPHLS